MMIVINCHCEMAYRVGMATSKLREMRNPWNRQTNGDAWHWGC